jgi:hypothetical protein
MCCEGETLIDDESEAVIVGAVMLVAPDTPTAEKAKCCEV